MRLTQFGGKPRSEKGWRMSGLRGVYLRETLGCEPVQGFYLVRPLAPDALDAWLDARRTKV